MKSEIPLRKRYFRDVARLGALVLLVCMVVLTGFNFMEYMEHKADKAEEFWEMILLFAALAGVFPIMLWLAWTTSGRLLRPLLELRETVDRMRAGELDARIAAGEKEDDEVTELLRSVEGAFEAHREALRRLDRFSADVSHQLRTPLTAMRTAGESCLSRERTAEEYRETLGGLLEQSDRLARVVDQLLLLARVARDRAREAFVPVELEGLTRRVLAEFLPIWEDRGAGVEVTLEEVRVSGNPVWLEEALRNLLNNATVYAPDPARFRIGLEEKDGRAEWRVEDSGPGIPPERRDRLFERFERGGHHADGGTGLGLAIVQEVARVHGGAPRMETPDAGGCRFILSLPAARGAETEGGRDVE
jgi:signal transduction histidine kinase